jgi:hypothetical protein
MIGSNWIHQFKPQSLSWSANILTIDLKSYGFRLCSEEARPNPLNNPNLQLLFKYMILTYFSHISGFGTQPFVAHSRKLSQSNPFLKICIQYFRERPEYLKVPLPMDRLLGQFNFFRNLRMGPVSQSVFS